MHTVIGLVNHTHLAVTMAANRHGAFSTDRRYSRHGMDSRALGTSWKEITFEVSKMFRKVALGKVLTWE